MSADHLSSGKEADRFLIFTLCGVEYAVSILKVKEVSHPTEIIPLLHAPAHFRGVMSYRGQALSLIDLRMKFHLSKTEISPQTTVIILNLPPMQLGMIVDSVGGSVTLKAEHLSPPPDLETQTGNDILVGVARKDRKLILLLNIDRVISAEDLRVLRARTPHKAA